MYDNNGDIDSVFEIRDYSLLKFNYDPKDKSVSALKTDDYHRIRSLSLLGSNFVVLSLDLQKESNVHYYVINLQDNEPYLVGTDSYGEDIEDRSFYVTDHHQVLVENGAVAIVE